MRTQWQTANLDDIIRHYAKDFKPPEGEQIAQVRFYIDTDKRKVVFEMYVADKNDGTPVY